MVSGGCKMHGEESKPIYLKIREDLLRDFEDNRNKKLPSELELCRRYQVCRTTVHKALEYFLENDMIVRRAGKGTFFRDEFLNSSAPVKRVWGVIRHDWETWETDYYFCSVIQGIMSALGPDCQLSLEQYSDSLLYKLLGDREASSIWISPEQTEIVAMKQLADAERLVVAVNRRVAYPGIRTVSIDHAAAGTLAARELAGAGHTKACAVYLESEQAFYGKMKAGIEETVRREALPLELHDAVVPQADWHKGATELFRRLYAKGERTFLIHTTSLVPLFLAEIARSGLRLGHDVFLFVYGDSFSFERDGVSAIRQPGMRLGVFAGKIARREETGGEYLLDDLEILRRGSLAPVETLSFAYSLSK